MPHADQPDRSRQGLTAPSSSRRGFTLIELLVVLGMIAALVGVMLPALTRSRHAARGCQCLCQMRSLGQFTALYADTCRDAMPRSQHSAFAAGASPWGYAFFEYLTDRPYTAGDPSWATVFNGGYRCPLDRRRERWSYGYNVYFELTPEETGGPTWSRYSSIPRPSGTVLFTELSNQTTADHAMAHYWVLMAAPPEVDADRHRPGCAAAFVDGHAVVRPLTDLFELSQSRDAFDPRTAR